MALASKKQNLELFYNMFTAEYETSMRNIEMCKEKADHIYELVQRQWEMPTDLQSCLVNYDKALTDISQLSDKLRKFNIQLELESLHKAREQPPREKFTFPRPHLLDYEIGYDSECIISHVKDAKNKLFYITLLEEQSVVGEIASMKNYFNDDPRQLEQLPRDGEVFGLYLDKYMFRAVKENGNSDKFSNFNAFLIDIGEIVTVNEYMPMFVLPVKYQQLPAQAVLCKLEQVYGQGDVNLSDYLGKSLYVKHKFRVTDKDTNMLFVNLYTETNPFRNKILDEKNNTATDGIAPKVTNPFKRYLCIKTDFVRSQIDFSDLNCTDRDNFDSNVTIENSSDLINDSSVFDETRSSGCNNNDHHELLSTRSNSMSLSQSNSNINGPMNGFDSIRNNELVKTVNYNNSFDMSYLSDELNDTLKNRSKDINSANGVSVVTEEQRAILYEEPLNTSNAMIAVMGYDPKDDKRICNFYDSKTKSCFKGTKCRLEHVEKIKEGWTRDEAATIVDIANQLVLPKIGEFITIIPTHIINVENFFAQIMREESRYEPTLKELIYKMNSLEVVATFKVLKSMPVQFELVIAKYTDGFWYRAKILNVIDEDTVKVFYLDYGNSNVISFEDVRMWDRRFDYLPFQAVRCKIAGIGERRSRLVEAAEQLRKMILNLSLKALVIDNIEYLHLQLWDVYNNDVADELLSKGLVDRKDVYVLRTNQLLPA